ncbi:branched-chain amino acid ABC transporter permease [Desulforhopalus sp. IMCC35007]|uniref:branched-chain amino acid ABC transporter permease n=1 Tax=Desulforhopalus sp. IMCC35007 TaxID=2569543 RepID=UPI0010AE7DC0|nr:branched-chain amino acid ABC transporter permease [Desulforhopalus sp. IMCC35007]TKB05858.1 branched-chain amino acid ABC transporter permease [Desulforhopalus sp. IMCC35007]
MLFVNLCMQGLLQGGIYALIAIGLTLVYGLLRILHVAHAGLYTLGGYIAVIVTNTTGSFSLGLMTSMLAVGLVGMVIYRLIYQPILDKPPFVALIASIGLFIALEEIYRIIFGPYGITFAAVPLQGAVNFAGTYLRECEIAAVLLATLLIAALTLFTKHSRIGIAWRATVTDPEMSQSFGVDVVKVRYLNFFIGSAMAAGAGSMVALMNNLVEPTMGSVPSYKALAIIVLGGLGNVRGTLIAALVIGIAETFGTIYLGDYLDRDSIAFAFLILVLMVKPTGLFAKG